MANRYTYSLHNMPRPQENYRQRLSNYQYNVMARNTQAMSIRTATRYASQGEEQAYRHAGGTTGNIYSAAKWRGGAKHQGLTQLGRYDPYALQQRKLEASYRPTSGYFENRLMQRIGGDATAYDRIGAAMGWQWDDWMQKEYDSVVSKMGPIQNVYADNALKGMISTRRYNQILINWQKTGKFDPQLNAPHYLEAPLY